ncbi:MAG: UDP-3-O-acyl-N-acetylglucosamine deacetylase [Comamonadaceae bacterium]|nr:UDP-3-O-acyl-N-acetylglucosamine deacetylase [Comamonadaceae bacterium]
MLKQRTLKSPIQRHRRRPAHRRQGRRMTLRPAAPDTGIVFRRVDLARAGRSPRRRPIWSATRGCASTLESATAPRCRTVEHLMSALAGLGIDNLLRRRRRARRCRSWTAAPATVRVPAAVGRHRASRTRRSASCASRSRSRCEDGDKWARFDPLRRLQARLLHRLPRIRCSTQTGTTVDVDFADDVLRQGGRARAHLRLHAGRRGDARGRAWRSAAACDNAIVMDEYRVLNSRRPALRRRVRASTRCSTPSATSTCSATR